MATRDWVGIAAGLALAGFGLGAFVASGPEQAPEPAPTPAVVVETVAPVETFVAQPTVEIPGISGAAARVLSTTGYVGIAQEEELGLPGSVIRLLESEGVVLLVPDGDGS